MFEHVSVSLRETYVVACRTVHCLLKVWLVMLPLQAAGAGRSNLGVHPMGYHNDNADIVFLLCLQRAAAGG